MNKKHIDLSLLVCLDALIAERSVTQAANRLGMSQPGMSNALARLRALTRDPLLVRTQRGMDPTPRARELAAPVKKTLLTLDEIFSDAGRFEPALAEGSVTIAASDSAMVLLAPRLRASLDVLAPNVGLLFHQLDPSRLRERLIDGDCDMAIGHIPSIPGDMHALELFAQTWCATVSSRHPVIREQLDFRQYVDADHVMTGAANTSAPMSETIITRILRDLGYVRKVSMRVPSIYLTPFVVAESNMLATIPTALARHYMSFLPLRLHNLPFDVPAISHHIVWHDRTHRSGLHRWIRGLVRKSVLEAEASLQTATRQS